MKSLVKNKFFRKVSPMEREWANLIQQEEQFLSRRVEKKESFLNQKLQEKVPEKLQSTLELAFGKAFSLIFDKGTDIIEKTYNRDEMEKTYQINQYTDEVRQTRKSLAAFSKKAEVSSAKNVLLSSVSGIGLGVLGVGLPDIPLFTGMMLKGIYEIALSYGFDYNTEEEKYFILLLIQGAVSYGEEMKQMNEKINDFMKNSYLPKNYQRQEMIQKTAALLSKELLYMKFLQGFPVVGAVGGAYDVIYMKQITEYSNLKYKHRFYEMKKGKIENIKDRNEWKILKK